MESEDYEFYKGLDFLLENKVSFVCFSEDSFFEKSLLRSIFPKFLRSMLP